MTQLFMTRGTDLRDIHVKFALGAQDRGSGDVHATPVGLLSTDTSFCQAYGLRLTRMQMSCVTSKLAVSICRDGCRLQQFLSMARPAPVLNSMRFPSRS